MAKDIRLWMDLIGNVNQKYFLLNAWERSALPHFILFTGSSGTGKSTMANLMTKTILCESNNSESVEHCGNCNSCINFDKGSNTSYVKINIPELSGKAEIKDIINNIFRFEKLSDKTVFVLEEIHGKDKSTLDIQRSLLDVLSNIPEDVYVISCTTRPYELLPELLNRAYVVELDAPTAKDCALFIGRLCGEYKIFIEDEKVINNLAEACGNSLRQISEVLRVVATDNKLTNESLGKMFKFAKDKSVLDFMEILVTTDEIYLFIRDITKAVQEVDVRSVVKRSCDFTFEYIVRQCTGSRASNYDKEVVIRVDDIFKDCNADDVSNFMALLGNLVINNKESESKKLSKLIELKVEFNKLRSKKVVEKPLKPMASPTYSYESGTALPVETTAIFDKNISSPAELKKLMSEGNRNAR